MPVPQHARTERAREQTQISQRQGIDDPQQRRVVLLGLGAGPGHRITRGRRNGVTLRGFAHVHAGVGESDQRQYRHEGCE